MKTWQQQLTQTTNCQGMGIQILTQFIRELRLVILSLDLSEDPEEDSSLIIQQLIQVRDQQSVEIPCQLKHRSNYKLMLIDLNSSSMLMMILLHIPYTSWGVKEGGTSLNSMDFILNRSFGRSSFLRTMLRESTFCQFKA